MYHPNYSHLCKTTGETVGGRSAFAARFFYRLATNQAAETRGPPSDGDAWTTKRRRRVDHPAQQKKQKRKKKYIRSSITQENIPYHAWLVSATRSCVWVLADVTDVLRSTFMVRGGPRCCGGAICLTFYSNDVFFVHPDRTNLCLTTPLYLTSRAG